MHPMTESNLHNAFAGESMAHMRYLNYARVADKEGFPNVARLFRAVSFAEEIHASNHLRKMDRKGAPVAGEVPLGLGKTAQNLEFGIMGETFEILEMYPVYFEVAKYQGEKAAMQTFDWAWQAEKVHQKMFTEAKALVDGGKDWKPAKLHICEVCGWTVEGDAPDTCPVCGAKKKQFREF